MPFLSVMLSWWKIDFEKFAKSVSVKTIVRLREWSYRWYKVEVFGGKGSEAVAELALN